MGQILKTAIKACSLLCFILAFVFCNSRNISEVNKDNQYILKDSTQNTNLKESNTNNSLNTNDSLALLLELKYPKVINTDTLRYMFTYSFQELIARNSNLVFFQNGRIIDIVKMNENYIITIDKVLDIQGQFIIRPQVWTEFVKYLKPSKTRLRGGFIVKVSSIIPVLTETSFNIDDIPTPEEGESISGSDLADYIHLRFNSNYRPYYILHGELVDFYITK
jgi:hypothetical protein